MVAKSSGLKWFNNGEIASLHEPGSEPEGWLPGRVKNTCFYRSPDNKLERQFKPGQQPEGWLPGRKLKGRSDASWYFDSIECKNVRLTAEEAAEKTWLVKGMKANHAQSNRPKSAKHIEAMRQARTGSEYWHHPETGECIAVLAGRQAPEGWARGRSRNADYLRRYGVSSEAFAKAAAEAMLLSPDAYSDFLKLHDTSHSTAYRAAKTILPDDFFVRSAEEIRFTNAIFGMIGIDFERTQKIAKVGNRKKEIDAINHEFKISVEYNGAYWHRGVEAMQADLAKAKAMRAAGYKHAACFFWDDVRKIADMLSPFKVKLYARKLLVKKVGKIERAAFENNSHLSGTAAASTAYGLYLGDELVQCMSFGKPRFNKTYDAEIVRLCTKPGFAVIGGAERLLAAFDAEFGKQRIISYSDQRFFDGKVYERLGFEDIGDSAPSYWWHGPKGLFPRYQAMKHKLPRLLGDQFDERKTEVENMQDAGFYQIFDYGHRRFSRT